MRDEAKFKEILRRIRTETPWEGRRSASRIGSAVIPTPTVFEVTDAEVETICYTPGEAKAPDLLVAIFDWLLDEAEHDPDRGSAHDFEV